MNTPIRRKQTPEAIAKMVATKESRQPSSERFWSRVERGPDCWNWQGRLGTSGYGQIKIWGKQWIASRVAWTLVFGQIPLGLCVCHHCDNPRCVNPTHLWLGTSQENMADMRQKARASRGERNHSAVLTSADVIEIRRLLAAGFKHRELSAQYGVAMSTIAHIATGRSWGHLAAKNPSPVAAQ